MTDHVPARPATETARSADPAPVDVGTAEDAREARYAEAIIESDIEIYPRNVEAWINSARAVLALVDAEVAAAVSEAQAEVERLTGSLEIALGHLSERGHPEDIARYARLHIERALEGHSRPLIMEQRRAESAEAEVERLREDVEMLRGLAIDGGWEPDERPLASGEAEVVEPWPFSLRSAAALIARAAWVNEPQQYQDEWSPRLIDEPDIRATTVGMARRRFASALAALDRPAPVVAPSAEDQP